MGQEGVSEEGGRGQAQAPGHQGSAVPGPLWSGGVQPPARTRSQTAYINEYLHLPASEGQDLEELTVQWGKWTRQERNKQIKELQTAINVLKEGGWGGASLKRVAAWFPEKDT